jgi:glycosyltransferase involved in cell wall biosynthesis
VNKLITLALSTYGERIENLRFFDFKQFEHEDVHVLIIHQVDVEHERPSWIDITFEYVQLLTIGVAKSRNEAIRCAIGKYIWFMDDDITIEGNALYHLRKYLSIGCIDLLILGIDFNNDVTPFVGASCCNFHELELFDVSKVGTPQIIVKTQIARREMFPNDLGAGTKKGIGDEPIFLSRLMKQKINAKKIDRVFIRHQVISSGDQYKNKILLRVEIYIRVYGIFGFLKFILVKVYERVNLYINA